MKFRTPLTPAGTYVTITSEIPLDTFTSGSLTAYQGFATVTALVSAAGSGTYVGADVKSSTGANGYAGWALVVVFRSEALPLRNLVVFDGFANVTQGEAEGTADTVETTLSNFRTPPRTTSPRRQLWGNRRRTSWCASGSTRLPPGR
jgi:hypothetical protein